MHWCGATDLFMLACALDAMFTCYPNIMQLGCRLVAWWSCWPPWLRLLDTHVYALWP